MSRYCGTIIGQAQTAATRSGSKEIHAAAQSWDGSVAITLTHNNQKELQVTIRYEENNSTAYPSKFVQMSFEQFIHLMDNFNIPDYGDPDDEV